MPGVFAFTRKGKDMTTLANLSVGQSARITGIQAAPGIRQRILDMGLIPDSRVTLERVGPTGRPIWIACHGSQIALRLDEATGILVDDVKVAGDNS